MSHSLCFETVPESVMSALLRDLPDIEYEYKTPKQYKEKVPGTFKKRRPTRWDLGRILLFQQMWGSTAMGFGGIGGAAMTTADVVIVEGPSRACCVYFTGRLAYLINRPNDTFWQDVRNWQMADVKGAKKRYEREE